MDKIQLSNSHFPAQVDQLVLETTVGGVLREQCSKTPAAIALVEAGSVGTIARRWTYGELFADAERLAHALLARFQPGERICVWAPNTPEWVVLEYAAALAGLTLVTANPAYQERELRYVLEQSGAVGLFLVREHRGNPMADIASQAIAANVAVREVVELDDAAALFAGAGMGSALPTVAPDDPVQIQYTSGTTGFPKGVVLNHRGLTNNARFYSMRVGVEKGSKALNFMPLFHTAGCGMMTLGVAQFGCQMILARMFDPSPLLDIIEAERIAYMIGVPTMLIGLLDAQAAKPRDVSSVQMIVSGGAMVPPDLVRRVRNVFGCGFQTVYAQTEASPVLTQTSCGDSIEDLCETAGRPLPQTAISIRDPHTNALSPIGAVGEICAQSYGIMIGYNDDPEASAKAIDKEGWLHTGDLGTMDSRGYVRVTGRVKDMIIRGGENLFPVEIENVLLEHSDIAEVAVVGIPDDRWGETVACFMRPTAGAALNRLDLIEHCRDRISPQKTPTHWIEVKNWPFGQDSEIRPPRSLCEPGICRDPLRTQMRNSRFAPMSASGFNMEGKVGGETRAIGPHQGLSSKKRRSHSCRGASQFHPAVHHLQLRRSSIGRGSRIACFVRTSSRLESGRVRTPPSGRCTVPACNLRHRPVAACANRRRWSSIPSVARKACNRCNRVGVCRVGADR